MSTTKAARTQEERIQKRRRRSQRYHPLMEPMMLPEGFVETVHRILGSYVHDLRSALSFLDQKLELPLVSLGFDLRMDREYGKKGEPDVDDARVTITFHDGKNGPNCQRYTWAFADGPETREHVRVRSYSRRRTEGEGRKREGGERKEEAVEQVSNGVGEGFEAEGAGEHVDRLETGSDLPGRAEVERVGVELEPRGEADRVANSGVQEGGEVPEGVAEPDGAVDAGAVEAGFGSAAELGDAEGVRSEIVGGIEEVGRGEDADAGDDTSVAMEPDCESGHAIVCGGWGLVPRRFLAVAAPGGTPRQSGTDSTGIFANSATSIWKWIVLLVLFGLAVFVRSAQGGLANPGMRNRTVRAVEPFHRWGERLRRGEHDSDCCGNREQKPKRISA